MWVVRTNDFKTASIVGEIISPTKKDMTAQAIKKLLFFWGLMLVWLPFPGLHFILPPVFFVLGIRAYFNFFKNTAFLHQGGFSCPACSSFHEIKKWFFKREEKLRCTKCGTQVRVIQQDGSKAQN